METSPLEEHALGSLIAGLIDLDPDAVRRVTSERLLDGAPSVIAELLVPAGTELRRRRREGEIDEVTLVGATGLLRRAVLVAGSDQHPHLYPVQDAVAPDRPRVVVTCPAGVDHLLGAEALGEVLRGIGWPVDVVADAGSGLGGHLTDRSAVALIVSCTDETGLAEVARAVDAAHAVGVPVVVTGPALGSDGLRALRLGADVWIAAVEGVAVVLDSWRNHHVPVAGPQGLPDEFAAFEMAQAAIVATALAGADVAGDGGVRHLVDRVVANLGAAVLVDDTRILLDHLALQLGQDDSGGLQALSVVGLVDAVAGAVPPELERSRRFISEAREHLRRSLSPSRSLQPIDEGSGARPPAVPRPASDEPVVPGIDGAAASPGQAFADLLLLGALACQAPVALLSVPQPDGQWSTLSYGCEHRQGLNDPLLFEALARRNEAAELADLTALPDVARSPLAAAPHNLRWAYGVALRAPDGVVLGVFCVLDRWARQLSRREQRATMAVGRQMGVQLSGLRKATPRPGWSAKSSPDVAPAPSVLSVPSIVASRRSAGLPEGQQLLRSHEVAVLFDVTERTVINWAAAGKLPSLRTIGGHLRFRSEDVHNLLAGRTVSGPGAGSR
jgi:excisionase family DNA binding protein